MNKQELADKLWKSANTLRANIDANEYKDYILGFIFYRYLSEKELHFLQEQDFDEDDIRELTEEDSETVRFIQKNIGYFIAYRDLYSTWREMGQDFSVKNVVDALNAFSRLISPLHKKLFDKIFDTLSTGLGKLGNDSASQTKAIRKLLDIIADIPMGNTNHDYDVLGYVYEYLISNFAANAGKKAGEFYTPHEVSQLMADIVADHTKGKDHIEIYDPTSGSGSLLITIGQAEAKYRKEPNSIKYFAQEIKENTFNLTRMNLVMRNIIPDNIEVRNGDTLEDDWPFFDENHEYTPLYLDGVVSNPPYSQHWDPKDKENDPRFAGYGLAPSSKADYAFLLHDLYHLRPDGIMTIVLPHGVLFRGGEEGEIRKNLLEQNHIDTIIGLPANIFFGTGIPTIIMVLRQKRENRDVLFIDASKGFAKEGKNNKLRARDIKKIFDTYKARADVPKFSRKVSIDEIRVNDYNLNIPRYVDSSDDGEHWDLYSLMYSGVSEKELSTLDDYWTVFPSLKAELFRRRADGYFLPADDIHRIIEGNREVQEFKQHFHNAFDGFSDLMDDSLIDHMEIVPIASEEEKLSDEIFRRMKSVPLVDPYEAYQLLDRDWTTISADLEMIQTEGEGTIRRVDPNMVTKKKNGKDVTVQDGWVGRIIPFALAQRIYFPEDLASLEKDKEQLADMDGRYTDLMDQLPEDEAESLLNDDNNAFDMKKVEERAKEVLDTIETEETRTLEEYLALRRKNEKLSFIENHPEIHWHDMSAARDGTYGKSTVSKALSSIRMHHEFPDGTVEKVVLDVMKLKAEEGKLKKQLKAEEAALTDRTIEKIEHLTPKEIHDLLYEKWVGSFMAELSKLPGEMLSDFEKKLDALRVKYEETYPEVSRKISETETSLTHMMKDLQGSEKDMEGLHELEKLLGGD